MHNRLSLSLEDSQSGEAELGVLGVLEETSGRQDSANTTEDTQEEVVCVGRFNFFSNNGTCRSGGNKGHMQESHSS